MFKHHAEAIERFTSIIKQDDRYIALIIGGSIMHGNARPDSDLDVMLIVTDEYYKEKAAKNELWYYNEDKSICSWEGGFIDGKIFTVDYLRLAAKQGSEPTRYSFQDATVAFTREPEVNSLVREIATYPEEKREERIKSFYSCAHTFGNFFMAESERRNSIYLRTYAASHLALFAARLMLAYNRVLFPSHKWMLYCLSKCKELPPNYIELIETMLKNPCLDTSRALLKAIEDFKDWNISHAQATEQFVKDTEQGWTLGEFFTEDC